jgi:translation elongation factor EF-Tu-like GTPase
VAEFELRSHRGNFLALRLLHSVVFVETFSKLVCKSLVKPMKAVDDFEAEIRILRFDEGGRRTAPFNGIRWDFNYAFELPTANLYMIWPDFFDALGVSRSYDRPLPIDVALPARMTIVVEAMRTAVHQKQIEVGTHFYCCEGPQRVAEGRVTKITGLHQQK